MARLLLGALVLWLALASLPAPPTTRARCVPARRAPRWRAATSTRPSRSTPKRSHDKTLPNERRAIILTDRGVAHARRQSPKEAHRGLQPGHPALSGVCRRLQQSRQRAAGRRRRARGDEGFRPRAGAGAGLCRGLLQSRRRAHAARPDRPGGRRLHQGDRAGAGQPGGVHRARARASCGLPARRAPSATSRAPSRSMRVSAPPTAAAPRPSWPSSATTRRSRTSAARSPSRRATPTSICCAGTAYLEAGNAASAIKDFATAIELSPQHGLGLCGARLRLRQGRGLRGGAQRFRARHRARSALAEGICLSGLDLPPAAAARAGAAGTSSARCGSMPTAPRRTGRAARSTRRRGAPRRPSPISRKR